MNLPNRLTVLRIILAVFFLAVVFVQGSFFKLAALLIFLAASLTDYWDGRLARRLNQITPFGKLMDPVADKVLTLSAFLGFVQLRVIPAWMVVVILVRDFILTGHRLLTLPGSPTADVSARKSGKHKTVLQFAAIIGILLYLACRESVWWDASWTAPALRVIYAGMLGVVAVTLWTGLRYLWVNRDFLKGP